MLSHFLCDNYVPAPWKNNTFTSDKTQLPSKMLNLSPLRWRWYQCWHRKHIFSKHHTPPKRTKISRERIYLHVFQKGSKMITCSIAASWPSGIPTRATASTGLTGARSILCSPRTSAFTFSPQTSAGTSSRFLFPHHLFEGMKLNCCQQLREHTVPCSGEDKKQIQWSPKQV